ncbi:MAG: Sec-independent protein translocase protein TatB [Methylotenera sp.]
MFDVSFSELIVVAIVALLVIGPERLPKVARTLGALTGRMQKYVAQIKEEVNREVRFDELQQLQQEIKDAANKTQANIKSGLQSVSETFTQGVDDFELTAVNRPKLSQAPPIKDAALEKTIIKKTAAKKVAVKKASVKKAAIKKVPAQE